MNADTNLLRQYVKKRSESAFAQLVQAHLNMVYSAALREMSGDGALAEDISQSVFTQLARSASSLLNHPNIAGWLYVTVRHSAANLRRSEQHRRRREQEAQIMNESLPGDSPQEDWQQIEPMLDDALHELKEPDREAIVLRFLEERPLREVGARLGLNENAARMRVERALEKLRGLLARRGVTSTASGVAAALALGALTPAPSALAATITTTVLASGAIAGSSTLTLVKLMSLTKISVISALVLAGLAVPAWQQTRLHQVKSENAQLRAQEEESNGQKEALAQLQGEVERLRKVQADKTELEELRRWQAQTKPELLRLRGMAGVARRANEEADQLRAQLARQQNEPQTNLMSGAMAEGIKQAMEQQVERRLSRMKAVLHLTPEQEQAAKEILLRQAQAMSEGMQQAFSGKYDKDELMRSARSAGNPDTQIKALLTPEQAAQYPTYQQEEAAYNARMVSNQELLQLQSAGLTPEQEDRAFGALYDVNLNQLNGTAKPPATNHLGAMQWLFDQKAKALEPVLTATQMDSYRQQQASQLNIIKDVWDKMGFTADSK